MIQCLIHPITHQVVAELTPEKEIVIHDKILMKNLVCNGITVSPEFKKEHCVGWRVYPTDSKEIFAKAFAQFYFIHGLQQQGYKWESKSNLKIPIEERIVQQVLIAYAKSKQA